jgi:hypothetical protein
VRPPLADRVGGMRDGRAEPGPAVLLAHQASGGVCSTLVPFGRQPSPGDQHEGGLACRAQAQHGQQCILPVADAPATHALEWAAAGAPTGLILKDGGGGTMLDEQRHAQPPGTRLSMTLTGPRPPWLLPSGLWRANEVPITLPDAPFILVYNHKTVTAGCRQGCMLACSCTSRCTSFVHLACVVSIVCNATTQADRRALSGTTT